ncbi:hypothetical protein V6N13_108569 [Hibiscus sabdariffa]
MDAMSLGIVVPESTEINELVVWMDNHLWEVGLVFRVEEDHRLATDVNCIVQNSQLLGPSPNEEVSHQLVDHCDMEVIARDLQNMGEDMFSKVDFIKYEGKSEKFEMCLR